MLHTSKLRNIRVGSNLERIIFHIQDSINIARIHLKEHVTTEGKIISLDEQCEYCVIYYKTRQIYFS